jgi:hypothetical protein
MRLLKPINDRQWFIQNPKRRFRLRRTTAQEEAALVELCHLPKEWRGKLVVLVKRCYYPRYGGFRDKLYWIGQLIEGELRPGGGFPGCCDISNDAMLADLWRRVEEVRAEPVRPAIVEMEDDG